VRELQSIAQAGLTFAENPYDLERYAALRRVASEIAAHCSDGDAGAIEGFFASERGYPTPKLDVRAVVIVGTSILLVDERDGSGWSLPGGWADVGESAAQAAARETQEEAGVEVRPVKLIALYDRQQRGHPPHPEYSYKLLFACHPISAAAPRPGPETAGAAFFDRHRLPPLSLVRVLPEQIELGFRHHANPDLPTEFD
jgi:ADP-ribose pyrophosphatase YjhB (NUDIX family)